MVPLTLDKKIDSTQRNKEKKLTSISHRGITILINNHFVELCVAEMELIFSSS